ncbi:NUDIX hydrolase [Shimazuella kribbensis]|uniref:NUDIX hydrolase n=1 Tax=Shimazuella kribbensis TaxID=139808 RepID=UPI0006879497|nr:NUDIX hydrolase [Shimazuella kribbensis]
MRILKRIRNWLPDPDIHRYHIVVSAIIFDDRGNVLVMERDPDDPGASIFEVPGGGIDPLELTRDAVAREVDEETGLKVSFHETFFEGAPTQIRRFPFTEYRRVFNFVGSVEGVKPKVRLESGAHVDCQWVPKHKIRSSGLPDYKLRYVEKAYAIFYNPHPMN